MKPLLVRIDENPREVLSSFSDEELLMELLLRDETAKNYNPTPVKVEYVEPVHEFIMGIGRNHSVQLFIHDDSLQALKEIACLN